MNELKRVLSVVGERGLSQCDYCNGSGIERLVPDIQSTCQKCNGSGVVKTLEVFAEIQVPSDVRHEWEVITL